jgi:hypothetical protein
MTVAYRIAFLSALAVAGATLSALPAPAQGATTGEWTVVHAEGAPQKVEVDFRSDKAASGGGHWNSSFDSNVSELGSLASALDSDGKPVRFTLAREAGSFACEGWAGHGRASGTFTFTPSAAFLDGLRRRGYDNITIHQQLAAATLDLGLGYIDGIGAAGFASVPFDKLIAFRALSVTRESILGLRKALGDPLSVEDVTSLTALHVTPAYVDDMRSLGVNGLSSKTAIELRALGINHDYVQGLAHAGYSSLSARDLVQLKALGVDVAYVRRLADHGFKNLTVSELVRMKAVGI